MLMFRTEKSDIWYCAKYRFFGYIESRGKLIFIATNLCHSLYLTGNSYIHFLYFLFH